MTLTIPDQLQDALTKPVAIFGSSLSGEGVLALLRMLGLSGEFYDRDGREFNRAAAASHRLAVFSPGFAPNHPWMVTAFEEGMQCMSELDFASLFWRGQVVAVTGTNGKTTLTEFLTHALRMNGEEAYAAGNIGRAFSTLVADTAGGSKEAIVVCEVSSFQAETLQHLSPNATLWANFAEDHLERHPGMEAYFSAKWNLVARSPEDAVLIGTSVQNYARKFNRELPTTAWVASDKMARDPQLDGTVFADAPQRENFLMAAAWWKLTKRNPEVLYTAARSFGLGRHRLQKVSSYEGVDYWNDSKATNFHAVEAAVGRFQQPLRIILGGKPKGGDIEGFVKRLAPRLKKAYLIGENAPILMEYFAHTGAAATLCTTLDQAVTLAAGEAESGDQVILSPGFASFDQFANYEARGNKFEEQVHALGSPMKIR